MTDSRDGNSVFTAQSAQTQGFSTRNVMQDDFGMEVPVEIVPLPSEGKIYPTDSASHNRETIEIKAMTAREEDILTSRALIKKGTVISQLLKSCIVDSAIKVDDLISGDRNALMTAIRITGYGSEYTVEVNCPECDERSKESFELSELPIKRLKIVPVEEGENAFEYELPVSKKKVIFKFLTGKDETNMSLESERRKKKRLGGDIDNMVTKRLHYAVLSVDGITDKNKIATFIRNMPAKDSRTLRNYMDDNEPGIEMKAWMTCESCFEQSEVNLPIGATFFWPDTE
jgi:hypothetical protein